MCAGFNPSNGFLASPTVCSANNTLGCAFAFQSVKRIFGFSNVGSRAGLRTRAGEVSIRQTDFWLLQPCLIIPRKTAERVSIRQTDFWLLQRRKGTRARHHAHVSIRQTDFWL